MEQNVFNRKLFKRKSDAGSKTAARDKLRSMGGIMASSEPLLQEAMKAVQGAPTPQIDIQGIMQAQKRMGPMPTAPMPQVAPQMPQMQPQPQPPMSPQPAPPPQAPAQPAPPMGLNIGGRPMDRRQELANYLGAATGPMPQVDIRRQAGSVVQQPEVDMDAITPERAIELTSAAQSGKFPVNLRPFTAETAGSVENAQLLNDKAEQIAAAMTDPNLDDEDRSRNLLAALGGDASASNVKKALADTSEQVFGKKVDREAKIDAINDAITGFAIAAGTSPRASKNIANGMLVGLKSMKETEQGRINTENALALAAAKAAAKGTGSDGTYNKLYQKAIEKIMTRPDEFGIFVDEDDPAALDSASNQITTLADRIARAQAGGGPAPSTTQPMQQIVAKDEAGNEFYSTDGVNFVDKNGNPYVPPKSTG
jgi:hypothetical protein